MDSAASASLDREGRAFVQDHGDVGAQQVLDLHRPLRGQLVARPSMWERKVTPGLGDLAQLRKDMTWKPPESVRIGRGQFMKRCRPPRRATRSAPGRSIR